VTEQGTEEWHEERLGKVTASRITDMLTKAPSGNWGSGRKNYAAELVIERLTGARIPAGFSSRSIELGKENEAEARRVYSLMSDNSVEQVGFINHPKIEMSGCSPDGLVGEDGCTEFKCPNTATHIEYLLGKKIDKIYLMQMQWQMSCTRRKWNDFNSYDPRMPGGLRLKTIRVPRDDYAIVALEKQVREFLSEVEKIVDRLRKL